MVFKTPLRHHSGRSEEWPHQLGNRRDLGQPHGQLPQLFGDLVFGSFGKGLSGQRLVAVRPEKPGSRKGELVYDIRKSVPLVPSFVVKDGLLYLWTDSGIVTCVDAATGKEHWRQRVGGEFYSSPIWIEGRLYCISKYGQVVVSPPASSKCWPAWNWMKRLSPPQPSPTASCICVRNRVCTQWEKRGRLAT